LQISTLSNTFRLHTTGKVKDSLRVTFKGFSELFLLADEGK
jgi:hypothetical protein